MFDAGHGRDVSILYKHKYPFFSAQDDPKHFFTYTYK